jgi:hypothetical protein
VERQILSSLCGDIAATYLADHPSVERVDLPDREVIARQALEALGPRMAELVLAAETSSDPLDDDETTARELALALAGAEPSLAFGGISPAIFYLEWLRAEGQLLVLRYRAAILATADLLDRREVLNGRAVTALVYPRKPKRRPRKKDTRGREQGDRTLPAPKGLPPG